MALLSVCARRVRPAGGLQATDSAVCCCWPVAPPVPLLLASFASPGSLPQLAAAANQLLLCGFGARCFSTRRKTAKAIGAWQIQKHLRRQAFKEQRQLKEGPLLSLPPSSSSKALTPKYAWGPPAVSQQPTAPALFDRICLCPPDVTRRSLPEELLHAPPQRPLGRASSLKSCELAAAALKCSQQHRDHPAVWRQLTEACIRRGPHFAAAEAALVLHSYAAAGRRELPLLRCCVQTLQHKWDEVRLLDAARALHALFSVFGIRDTRLLLRCIDSFGPLLRQHSSSSSRRAGALRDGSIAPAVSVQHLYTLALLLKTFAAVPLPYTPLLHTAAAALRAQLQQALPLRPKSPRSLRASRIFSLPSIDADDRGPQAGVPQGPALPPNLLLSLLEGLGALGVRSEPLLEAFEAFVEACLPETETVAARGQEGSPPRTGGPPSWHRSRATAAYWGSPPYAYAASKPPRVTLGLSRPSGWLEAAGPGEAGGPLGAQSGGTHGLEQKGKSPAAVWSLRQLSRSLKAIAAVGRSSPSLTAGWVSAVRYCSHIADLQDLVLALETARLCGFFSRPLLQQLLCRLRHKLNDEMLVAPQLSAVLAAATAAAQLPAVTEAFWHSVRLNLRLLQPSCLPGDLSACCSPADDQQTPQTAAAAAGTSTDALPVQGEQADPPEKERPLSGAPQEPLSLTLAAALVQAVALSAPVLPLKTLHAALPVLLAVEKESLRLSSSLRLSAMLLLARLKAAAEVPPAAGLSSSSSSADLASAIRRAEEAVWGCMHSRVASMLQQQQQQQEAVALQTKADESKGSSWSSLVEGPLALSRQLRELCLYGVLSGGGPGSEECLTKASRDERPPGVSSAAKGVLLHARRLVAARKTHCPLVFGCVAEAVAMLHLELLPLCRGEAGMAVAAALRLLPASEEVGPPQQRQQRGRTQQPQTRRLGLQPARSRSCTDEERHSSRMLTDSDAASAAAAHRLTELWAPCRDALETILSCFSSRLVTAATPVVLHAAEVLLKGLSHPRCQEAAQQRLGSLREAQPRGEFDAGKAEGWRRDAVPSVSAQPLCGAPQNCPVSPRAGLEEGPSVEADVVELLCALILLALETLEERIPMLQANELALLASDIQKLLHSSFFSGSAAHSMTADSKGDSERSHVQGDVGLWQEASNAQQLARKLSTSLQAVAHRWRAAPATVLSTGPASSCYVWLCLGKSAEANQLAAGKQTPQGSPLDVVPPAAFVEETGQLEASITQAGRAAWLETLCPATCSLKALQWPRGGGKRQHREDEDDSPQHRRASPEQPGICLEGNGTAKPRRGSWKEGDNAASRDEQEKRCNRSRGHQCSARPKTHADVSRMKQWLLQVHRLHAPVTAAVRGQGAGAHSAGLLCRPEYRDLALIWLSHLVRSQVF